MDLQQFMRVDPIAAKATPLNLPENPIDYLKLVERPEGIGTLSQSAQGTKVAIIGGGSAGLCAAYELMRVGAIPVVFEAQPRLGGRCYTYEFSENGAIAELGAMRFPTSQQVIFYYLDKLGIKETQKEFLVDGEWPLFPSPKAVNTRIYFQGQSSVYLKDENAYVGNPFTIQQITAIDAKFNDLLEQDLGALQKLDKDYNNGFGLKPDRYQEYVGKRLALWSKVVDAYQNKSLFEALVEYRGKFGKFAMEEIELLGAIGIGTGGIGALYTTAYLETLREAYHKDDRDQRLVVGGISQLAYALWEHPSPFWRTSVKSLNKEKFQRKVTSIRTPQDPLDPITVEWANYDDSGTVIEGGTEQFSAVILTCSLNAIEMGININREAFSEQVWYAIRNFGMIASQKVFIRTKTPFWNQWNLDRDNPLEQIVTTLSDTAIQQAYFFDKKDFGVGRQTDKGVALISYSWDSKATKFDALSDEEKFVLCMDNMEEIYGKEVRDKFEEEKEDVRTISWELENGFNGAFRMANPGQYQEHEELFNQGLGKSQVNNGLYLAGEALSWYGLSGWVDGALCTGINTALATIRRLNSLPACKLTK